MPDDGTAPLVQTVHACAEAIVSNDAARIDTFVTDDWVLVTPKVGIVTREASLEADEWTTDVFHRDHGRWRCSLTQLTPVTPRPEDSP